MSPDIEAVTPGTQVGIQLRQARFDLMMRIIGRTSDVARAELIGVDEKTIRRARQGTIGGVFMARTVAALRKHSADLEKLGIEVTLDALFEVVEAPELAEVS